MLRMLVVDDQPTVCKAIQAALEASCGATVICSQTGTSADAVLRSQRLDAAIVDAFLPDISGFELAERVAKLNVPVLLMAGHPDAVDVCATYSYPYLAKPFTTSKLADEVMGLIRCAAENIAGVLESSAKLRATATSLSEAMDQARRTVRQSAEIAALA